MKIFNSIFENKLRLNILINIFQEPVTLERIYALDFISLYGEIFCISKENLHGNNQLMFSEFASRREIVRLSLKELVLEGFVSPMLSIEGIKYFSTENGKLYSSITNNNYANEYRAIAEKVIEKYKNKLEREILSVINKKAISFLNKGK